MSQIFNRAMLEVARAARGFTQGQLAERAGVTQALISKIENGIVPEPSRETVQSLAAAMRLPEPKESRVSRPESIQDEILGA